MNVTEQMTSGEWLARQLKKEEDRAKKPDAPKKPKSEPEHQMQCEIYVDFNRNYPDYRGLLFAVPNGGQRNKIVAAKLKREGVQRGVPDLMLPVPRGHWHGLFVELKVLPNQPSDAQRQFMERLTQQGYYCQVVYTREQAQELFKSYLTL